MLVNSYKLLSHQHLSLSESKKGAVTVWFYPTRVTSSSHEQLPHGSARHAFHVTCLSRGSWHCRANERIHLFPLRHPFNTSLPLPPCLPASLSPVWKNSRRGATRDHFSSACNAFTLYRLCTACSNCVPSLQRHRSLLSSLLVPPSRGAKPLFPAAEVKAGMLI